MKRKILAVCMALGVILSLGGCGNSGSSDSGTAMTESKSAAGATMDAAYNGTAEEIAEADPAASYGEDADGAPIESGSDTGGAEVDAEVSTGQKLIKTVNMSVETTEFDQLIGGLKTRTEQLGGYVEGSEISSSSGEYASRWGSLVLRIPADQLDSFVEQVGEDANVTYSNESTEDVTLSYVDMESHLAALRTEQETLMSMLEKAESLDDILTIQTQLTQVRYEIESYESQLRVYDNRVNYSTVYMDVREVVRETSAAGTTFGESVKTRFGDNLYRVGRGFRNFAIGFLGAIPVIVVVVVIVIVIIFAVRRVQKCKRKWNEKKRKKDAEMAGKERERGIESNKAEEKKEN